MAEIYTEYHFELYDEDYVVGDTIPYLKWKENNTENEVYHAMILDIDENSILVDDGSVMEFRINVIDILE